jgi:uncharacterized protein (DUF2235 family)
MSKFVVFCADGTWNGPDQDENDDRQPDPTNVYKLFVGLAGQMATETRDADEQEKSLSQSGQSVQVAKYIHGVGDSRNPIKKLIGGAFGAGLISRIVRGYTFISRNYEPGDHIVVIGFSRGAYTARALAGLIVSQGVLAKHITVDKTRAYRCGAQAWYRYRQRSNRPRILAHLAEVVADLPAFLSKDALTANDLVPIDRIKAVGVWDTVGSLGLPKYMDDERYDAFKFADARLSQKAHHGFHAVALDEQRVDFTPTLWDEASNVTQVAFPGAHGDVGGGYPMPTGESGLSDIALDWMTQQLTAVGVQFNRPIYTPFAPDPAGVAHQPWRRVPFNAPGKAATRDLKGQGLSAHDSIDKRRIAGPVIHHPGDTPATYTPTNRQL